MDSFWFIAPVFLSFLIFFIPVRYCYFYALFLSLFIIILSAIPSVITFAGHSAPANIFCLGFGTYNLCITIDKLNAFFILVTDITVLTGLLFSAVT